MSARRTFAIAASAAGIFLVTLGIASAFGVFALGPTPPTAASLGKGYHFLYSSKGTPLDACQEQRQRVMVLVCTSSVGTAFFVLNRADRWTRPTHCTQESGSKLRCRVPYPLLAIVSDRAHPRVVRTVDGEAMDGSHKRPRTVVKRWAPGQIDVLLRSSSCVKSHSPPTATVVVSTEICFSRSRKLAFKFDLATGSVRGKPILHESAPAVTAALGPPDERAIHKTYAVFRYGKLGRKGWSLMIIFHRRGNRLRVTSIVVSSPQASEVRLGKILQLPPKQLQRSVARAYAGVLRLDEPYRCRRKPIRCRGLFASSSSRIKVAFGVFPPASSERYVLIYF